MAVIVAVTVFIIVPTIIIPSPVTTVMLTVTMSFLITRNIFAVVPVVLHKENTLAAGVVFTAVLTPIFGVTRRYAKIDRLAVHPPSPLNDYRPTVDHLWLRVVADINLAIEAWLAYAKRNANVGGEYRGGDGGSDYRCREHKTFHVESPVVRILKKNYPSSTPWKYLAYFYAA
jgi:hypothetical protein